VVPLPEVLATLPDEDAPPPAPEEAEVDDDVVDPWVALEPPPHARAHEATRSDAPRTVLERARFMVLTRAYPDRRPAAYAGALSLASARAAP
jgi:hypothetical protein